VVDLRFKLQLESLSVPRLVNPRPGARFETGIGVCMFGLGVWELALILAVVVIIFGAKRLLGLGEGLGRAVKQVRSETKDSFGPSGSESAEKKQDSSDFLSDYVLPEINYVRRLKARADKISRLSRWTKFRRF